jgi:hypothetical protein
MEDVYLYRDLKLCFFLGDRTYKPGHYYSNCERTQTEKEPIIGPYGKKAQLSNIFRGGVFGECEGGV